MNERFRAPAPPRLAAPTAYALGLAGPVLAFVVQTWLRTWVEPVPFVLFFLTVTLVAWVGGAGPALLSAVASAVLGGVYLALSPTPARAESAVVAAAVFLPVGALIASLAAVARAAVVERASASEALARSEARERARAAELEALVEAVPAFVWIARDPGGREVWANRAASQLLGLDPGPGAASAGATPPPGVRVLAEGRALSPGELPVERAARGEPVRGVELEVTRDDGTRRRILGNAEPIPGEDGAPRGAVAAFVDVSTLAEALGALRLREQELESAVQARDAFLSAASHELRTPLTSLSLVVQALVRQGRGASGDALAQRLATMQRQVGRLARLVDELLDVSRIASGKLRLDLEEVELGALVREVVARLEADHAPGASPVTLDLAAAVVGRWDRLRLDQILVNLLTNAQKYGEGRPIHVAMTERGGIVALAVRDRGIGIPAAEQERIFERFERGSAARNLGGIGLGLWIVRELASSLGGAVSVESAPGVGSTFTVTLPLAGPPAPVEATPRARSA